MIAAQERQKIVNKILQLREIPSEDPSSASTMGDILGEPYDETRHAQGWRTIKQMKCMKVIPIETSGREKTGIIRVFNPALDGHHKKCVEMQCGLAVGSTVPADCGDRNIAIRKNPPIYEE